MTGNTEQVQQEPQPGPATGQEAAQEVEADKTCQTIKAIDAVALLLAKAADNVRQLSRQDRNDAAATLAETLSGENGGKAMANTAAAMDCVTQTICDRWYHRPDFAVVIQAVANAWLGTSAHDRRVLVELIPAGATLAGAMQAAMAGASAGDVTDPQSFAEAVAKGAAVAAAERGDGEQAVVGFGNLIDALQKAGFKVAGIHASKAACDQSPTDPDAEDGDDPECVKNGASKCNSCGGCHCDDCDPL